MRKTTKIAISDPKSRDNGKVYLITEMPASKAEKWAARAFLALARSGAQVPPDIMSSGVAGLAVIGFQTLAGLDFADAEVLMEEMMSCVSFVVPNPTDPDFSRKLIEDDVEEVATRLRLRAEVFTLHTGFSLADAPSMFLSATAPASKDTLTSPAPSGQ